MRKPIENIRDLRHGMPSSWKSRMPHCSLVPQPVNTCAIVYGVRTWPDTKPARNRRRRTVPSDPDNVPPATALSEQQWKIV